MLVSVKQGELRLRLEAPASSTQGNGVVAGDSLASMLDLSMAMAVLSQLQPGRTCATISLTVNMMAAAQAGRILATASVERRASNAWAATWRSHGPLCSTRRCSACWHRRILHGPCLKSRRIGSRQEQALCPRGMRLRPARHTVCQPVLMCGRL
ncbi:PaaI family thioesterase [Variovorax sp. KBS0712]|uniref:PaaI family thioesterase n=1 Tax=Variovorax sp. KBS0712 TaxID=2578111 RepID=UPI00163DBDAB|nr:PaaI family thioesterase [Variovorax sp. KBS0712]